MSMARTAQVIGYAVAFAGAVWMLQGLNARFAPRSFMTNSRPWILYGAVAVAGGLLLARWGRNQG